LLTAKYGLAPEDIVFDPLVFPCATADENYIGGAVETMEGIRLIKQSLPDVRTILGISNVLWIAGRRTRGGELGFSVLLHEGGSGPGDREYRKARALCVHSVR